MMKSTCLLAVCLGFAILGRLEADSLQGSFNIEDISVQDVDPESDQSSTNIAHQLQVVVETDKNFQSKFLFCHVSFFDGTGKLITTVNDPTPTRRRVSEADASRGDSFVGAWPNVISRYTRTSLFFTLPDKLPDDWKAVVAFGSPLGAVASKYPADLLNSDITWDYPDKKLVQSTPASADIPDAAPSTSLIEEKVITKSKRYPQFTMILHLPPGVTSPKDVKGVMAMCLPVATVEDLRAALRDPNKIKGGHYKELYAYAESKNLAVLAWGARWVFDSYDSFDQLTDDEQQKWDDEFAPLADGWNQGVQKFVDDYGLPSNGYLAYGTSAGAAWIQRIVMAHPERFLAINFHVCDTFHAPISAGSQVLWLETTGEEDGGYQEAQKFYVAARESHYPIIFKAYQGLGHSESPNAYKFAELFFDYALSLKDQAAGRVNDQGNLQLDLSPFSDPPFVADFMNQVIYPKKPGELDPCRVRSAVAKSPTSNRVEQVILRTLWVWTLLAVSLRVAFAQEKISLPTDQELTRADIYVQPFDGTARATLVLCPGQNGNGQSMMLKTPWQEFAKKEQLNLVGVSFASPNSYLQPNNFSGGYYIAPKGSGQALILGLNRAFGQDQPPLLIYGFSGGAHFTFSFMKAHPELVQSWCAYSAGWWETPESSNPSPPGLIACGENDGYNYGPSLTQFSSGRSLGLPWTWLSVPETGHQWSDRLEDFVRLYFTAILDHPHEAPIWLDVDRKTPVSDADLKQMPTLGVWLPDSDVAEAWKQLHKP